MAAENIVINFTTNTEQIDSTITLLEKLGQVDKKTADEFRAATLQYSKGINDIGANTSNGFAKVRNEIKGIGQTLATSLVLDKSKDVVKTTSSIISLREQLKRATLQTAEFAEKFGALDSRTISAAKNAANLKERFSDVQKQINALNPEAKFTAFTQLGSVMSGAFQVATGALQAFGVESETATKLAQQFQGALNIAAGLNNLTNLKDALTNVKAALGIGTIAATSLSDETLSIADSTKDYNAALSAVKNTKDTSKIATDALAASQLKLATANTTEAVTAEGAAVATKSFTAALLTNPLFLALAAISALAGAYFLLKEDISDATKELEIRGKVQGDVIRKTDAERIKVGILVDEYKNVNTTGERRAEIINQLNNKYPEFFGNLDNEKDKTEALTKAYQKYIEVSALRAEADILINKIAENNAKIAEDTANGIIDNVKGIDKFTAAIFSVLHPGAAAAVRLKSGQEGLADATKKTGEETATYQKILQGVIDKLNAYGLGIDSTVDKEGNRVTKIKELSDKEKQLNSERLKEKRDLEYRLREIGISLIADEFEQRRQKLILAFDKEIDTYADKLQQKKITLEQFNEVFNALNKQLTTDTAEVTKQGLIKQYADEEALRKQQQDNILKVIEDQNIVLQTEDLNALNERIKAKKEALIASGADEVTVAKQTQEFINNEIQKLNEKRLDDELKKLEKQRDAVALLGGDTVSIEKQIVDKKIEIVENGNKKIITSDEQAAQKRKQAQEDLFAGLQVGLEIAAQVNEIYANYAESQIADIERVRDAELDSIDKRFAKNEEDKKNRTISERQFRDTEKKLLLEKEKTEKQVQDRINEIKRKQDIANRAQKIFEIVIATARNIVEAGNPYVAALYAILGAAQTAVVLSTPLPKYAKGTLSVSGKAGSGDSVHAMLTPGESVLPVDTTRAYHPTIKAVYNGSIPAAEMNKWVTWRLKYPQGNTSTTAVHHMDIDYDKLAAKIGKEVQWAVRGRNKVDVANLAELASMLNDANDIRRR